LARGAAAGAARGGDGAVTRGEMAEGDVR
jgi:hypothetical protein